MAEQMQEIKRRIRSIGSTERITNAMQLVSAAKLRKSRKAYENSKAFLHNLIRTMTDIFEDSEDVPDEYLAGDREIRSKCCMVITGSNGFCGSFNNNVIHAAEKYIDDYTDDEHSVKLVTIGSKGRDYFRYHGKDIIMEYEAPVDTLTMDRIVEITGTLINMYMSGEIDQIDLIYTSYINPLRQEVKTVRLLPFIIHEEAHRNKSENHLKMEYEPSPVDVFNYLVLKYVELVIHSTCIESTTCEYASRRMAMENAHNNASDMLAQLEVQYNRARQTDITNEIIEIVAGSQAQSQWRCHD